MGDALQLVGTDGGVENHEFRTADLDIGVGLDKLDAVDGGRGALVELSGERLHGEIGVALEVDGVGDGVGHGLAEDLEAALLEELGGETEEVVDAEQPQRLDVELEIGVELPAEALGLNAEGLPFLHKYSIRLHYSDRNSNKKVRFTREEVISRESSRAPCGPVRRGIRPFSDGGHRR